MNSSLQDVARIALVGVGATLVMDVWLALQKRAGVRTLDFALVGRWAGHLLHGRWKHDAIAQSPPIRGEAPIGWSVHYAVGMAFAALTAGVGGVAWIRSPTVLPALAVGIATVVAPLFVMQPAMGAGVASSRTAAPLRNCLRSLVNHAVFGAGLYAAAVALNRVWQ